MGALTGIGCIVVGLWMCGAGTAWGLVPLVLGLMEFVAWILPGRRAPAVVCQGGLTVQWCPRCGTCTCPPDAHLSEERDFGGEPACPIHGTDADHQWGVDG